MVFPPSTYWLARFVPAGRPLWIVDSFTMSWFKNTYSRIRSVKSVLFLFAQSLHWGHLDEKYRESTAKNKLMIAHNSGFASWHLFDRSTRNSQLRQTHVQKFHRQSSGVILTRQQAIAPRGKVLTSIKGAYSAFTDFHSQQTFTL